MAASGATLSHRPHFLGWHTDSRPALQPATSRAAHVPIHSGDSLLQDRHLVAAQSPPPPPYSQPRRLPSSRLSLLLTLPTSDPQSRPLPLSHTFARPALSQTPGRGLRGPNTPDARA